MAENDFIHPYIPNSVPEIRDEMLKAVGLKSVYGVYSEIPDRLRFKGILDGRGRLPAPVSSVRPP